MKEKEREEVSCFALLSAPAAPLRSAWFRRELALGAFGHARPQGEVGRRHEGEVTPEQEGSGNLVGKAHVHVCMYIPLTSPSLTCREERASADGIDDNRCAEVLERRQGSGRLAILASSIWRPTLLLVVQANEAAASGMTATAAQPRSTTDTSLMKMGKDASANLTGRQCGRSSWLPLPPQPWPFSTTPSLGRPKSGRFSPSICPSLTPPYRRSLTASAEYYISCTLAPGGSSALSSSWW